jgi:hypothetical protein
MNHFCETLKIDVTQFVNRVLNDDGLTDSDKNSIIREGIHRMHTKKHLIKTGCEESDKETFKTCMVCPSTDNVKRYKTKTHAGLIINPGDGYVEYCKKHAIEHGYWVE